MRHKITDLERKLRELDAMEQQTQHARVPASMATSGSDHSLSGPGLDVQGFPAICGSSAAALPYPLTISNEAAPFDVAHSHNTNPNDALQFYAGLMTPAAATENAVDILHQALIDAQYHTAADLVHQAPGNNPGEMLYSNLGVQSKPPFLQYNAQTCTSPTESCCPPQVAVSISTAYSIQKSPVLV